LWPANRIDRYTSGVLLFATSRKIREAVMIKWNHAEKTLWWTAPTLPEGQLIKASASMKRNTACTQVRIQIKNCHHPF